METNTSNSPDHHYKDPLTEFSENPLDIFYFYVGLLRETIKEVNPETWRSLLKNPPPTKKGTQK